MTEAELLESAGVAWSNFITSFSLAITIISGYLIVAYTVGSSLTRSQIILVNALFLGTMVSIVLGLNGFGASAADFESVAWAMTSQRAFEPTPWARWGVILFVVLIVFGALQFMKDVRHPKTK